MVSFYVLKVCLGGGVHQLKQVANFIGCPSKAKLISLAGSGATGNMNLPASAVSPLNLERWYCFIASMDIK